MKIVIAPDKFKGCLPAVDVAEAMANGIGRFDSSIAIDLCPMADGGEGTVSTLVAATGGKFAHRRVTGPLPEMKADAIYGWMGDGKTAVIEMAAAAGLALLKPEDRNPLNTTTFGVGELMAGAARDRAKKIILGIGGSATIDAGLGCAQACGFAILTRGGQNVSMTEPLCGRDLDEVMMVKHGRGEITNGVEIIVACDVRNPLCGPQGSAMVFGPQKGATPPMAADFDRALRELARRTGAIQEAEAPGAGAAGGLGFGMLAFFRAKLHRGFDVIAEAVKFKDRLAGADFCFTGEGQLDGQSAAGKVVGGVARLCKELNVPCIALAGAIGEGAEKLLSEGLVAYFAISDRSISEEDSHRNAGNRIAAAAEKCLRTFAVGPGR